jgi:hypothetical protein
LTEKVPNKQNRYACLVLRAIEIEVFFEIVQPGQCNGIAVQIIQPVHRPEHGLRLSILHFPTPKRGTRHNPSIELLHQSDLTGVRLFMGARVVLLLHNGNGLDGVIVGYLLLQHVDLGLRVCGHLATG